MSFNVLPGRSLLITCRSGAGKTTLLRAIAGIWPNGSRRIEMRDRALQVIMPETPYLPVGTFARLLLQRPDLIFLDETASDLDDESALDVYRILREELPDAMVVTVGHMGPLLRVHDAQLELRRCGERG